MTGVIWVTWKCPSSRHHGVPTAVTVCKNISRVTLRVHDQNNIVCTWKDSHTDLCEELRALYLRERISDGEINLINAWNICVTCQGELPLDYQYTLKKMKDRKV
jgi:hypothetical protein